MKPESLGAERAALALACLLALAASSLLPQATNAQTLPLDPAPFVFLRADEGEPGSPPPFPTPLDGLTRIDLGPGPAMYLEFGLDVRERYEHYGNAGFGLLGLPKRQDYLLSRILLDADLRLGDDVRAFVQLGRHDAPGKTPLSPVDADGFDVQQAFVELSTDLPGSARATLRLGRQEIVLGSGRFVDIREGPNVRQSQNGARAFATFGEGGRIDVFLVRPTLVHAGSFDDSPDPRQAFGGVYATLPTSQKYGAIDIYYLWLQTKNVPGVKGPTIDRRHTIGARLYGRPGSWDYDGDALFQFGSQGSADIRAGGVAVRGGYTIGLETALRAGLQADWFSGGKPGGKAVGTFNPLFPRGGYFSEPGLQTFTNLVDIYPSATLFPGRSVAIQLGIDFTWRANTRDAVYIAPTFPFHERPRHTAPISAPISSHMRAGRQRAGFRSMQATSM